MKSVPRRMIAQVKTALPPQANGAPLRDHLAKADPTYVAIVATWMQRNAHPPASLGVRSRTAASDGWQHPECDQQCQVVVVPLCRTTSR